MIINNSEFLKFKAFVFLIFFLSCSNEQEIEIKKDFEIETNTKYKTNVLIEDYTGAWCGWCPRVTYKLDDLWKITNKRISIVAIHNQDAFSFEREEEMRDRYWESGYGFPTAIINRNKKWSEQYKIINDKITIDSPLGLALESSLKNRTLSVKIKIGFGYDFSDLKLVVYLTENGLISNQANYAELGYGTDNPLVDFIHDNVLRASISELFGDTIDSSQSKNGEIFEKSYSYVIPESYSLQSNIVAFVVDGNDRAINSRFFSITENEAENGKFQLAK